MPVPPKDAIDLLIQDHEEVKDLFTQFDGLSNRAKMSKKIVAEHICEAVAAHEQLEEEIFLPEVRKSMAQIAILDDVQEEHSVTAELIAEIQEMNPGDDGLDAKITSLSDEIETHMQQEEDDLFPLIRETDIDLIALRKEMIDRKEEIGSGEIVHPV